MLAARERERERKKPTCLTSGAPYMVVNLGQNPKARPVASTFLPTLLRGGLMFLIKNPDIATDPTIQERWMLPQDLVVSCVVEM